MSVDTELGREISQIINIILQEVIQMQRERQYNEEQVKRSKVESEKATLVKKMNDDTRNSLEKIDSLLKQNDELVSQYGASIGDYIDEGLAEVIDSEMQVNKAMEGVYNRAQENMRFKMNDKKTIILYSILGLIVIFSTLVTSALLMNKDSDHSEDTSKAAITTEVQGNVTFTFMNSGEGMWAQPSASPLDRQPLKPRFLRLKMPLKTARTKLIMSSISWS